MTDRTLIDRIAYALADEPFPQPWWGGAEFRAKAEKIAKACGLGGEDLVSCWCWRCREDLGEPRTFYHLCPDCGNKRCPKATDHRNACTGSNEPGQPGSAYR